MAQYLTVEQYVARYGEQETGQLTFEGRAAPGATPEVDAAKVEAALADASDTVDAYVGTRYALPLPDVPRIVATWTATLAREFLYRSRPLPVVTEAADRTRSQLKDLSARKLDLPVPEGGAAAVQNANGDSATSGDAACSTFSGRRLDSFMGVFGHGSDIPRWMRGG